MCVSFRKGARCREAAHTRQAGRTLTQTLLRPGQNSSWKLLFIFHTPAPTPFPLSSSLRPSSWMNCLVCILVFSPTLWFPGILSIPTPIKGSWRATHLYQELWMQSWIKYISCSLSKREQTWKQSTEIKHRAAEGCTRYPETQGLGALILSSEFGKPSQRRGRLSCYTFLLRAVRSSRPETPSLIHLCALKPARA